MMQDLKGTLTDSAKSATFVMDTLEAGDKYKIAGKEYTIGSDKAEDRHMLLMQYAKQQTRKLQLMEQSYTYTGSYQWRHVIARWLV